MSVGMGLTGVKCVGMAFRYQLEDDKKNDGEEGIVDGCQINY